MDRVRKAANRGQSGSVRENHKHVNQVNSQAGMLGKGKDTGSKNIDAQLAHSSRPLNTLVDPVNFGPPPRHHSYPVEEAAPSSSTPAIPSGKPALATTLTVSKSVTRAMGPAPKGPEGGLGASMRSTPKIVQEEEQKAIEPPPPPVPYRINTTGLATDSLPPPPVFRGGAEGEAAVQSPTGHTRSPLPPPRQQQQQQQRPQPPPRLPPRQNSNPDMHASVPPPSYPVATGQSHAQAGGHLNQGAVDRLGQAGVSVPGFGVGQANTSQTAASPPTPRQQPAAPASSGQMNELQARFARMNQRSASPAQDTSAPAAGPSFNRPAVSPAPQQQHQQQQAAFTPAAAVAAAKKPPPPPPKKKSLMAGGDGAGVASTPPPAAEQGSGPPPVPLASKPK